MLRTLEGLPVGQVPRRIHVPSRLRFFTLARVVPVTLHMGPSGRRRRKLQALNKGGSVSALLKATDKFVTFLFYPYKIAWPYL